MKKVPTWQWVVLAAVLMAGTAAMATLPKVWTAETLRYSDLNANFAHLESALRGGTHTAIVNADISASAAIAHSKLATPLLLPRALAFVTDSSGPADSCNDATCTLRLNFGFTSCTRGAVGAYVCTIPARADVTYAAMSVSSSGTVACATTVVSTTAMNVVCVDPAGVAADAAFTIMIYDNA